MSILQRLHQTVDFVGTLRRARLITLMRPDRYVRMGAAARREGMTVATGFAIAAQRCPDRPGLIDELGTLTWRELDQRSDALAAALQALPGGQPKVVGIMARNHRGFVESLIAANRIGANVLLLNTSFAGPALAEVVAREGVDAVIYDEEFTPTISQALHDRPEATRIVAWSDDPVKDVTSVAALIDRYAGQRPSPPATTAKMILLTSGTTGSPKGAKHSGGGPEAIKGILDRTPWRAEEVTVIVAPMFHAWGFSQLLISALMACTIVTRRKFDPEATLALVDEHQATGLCVVPVMFDRIVDLPNDVRTRYSGRSLRVAAASGSRMRPDVVIKFMDQFGDVIYNNYNATEAGMIATATPADLRAAPDTAGKPADGTDIRILDADFRELPTGEVGTIYVRNSTQFDGYTSGANKDFHAGYMSSGDVGYLDAAGRLFVVGRDDEMIVSGGENVYPIEVEKTLAAHAEVAEAAVLGVDDEQYGQRLVAFVVLTEGAATTTDELKAHVRENLANYKVPRAITVLDELPRGSTGKIVRGDLQALVEPAQSALILRISTRWWWHSCQALRATSPTEICRSSSVSLRFTAPPSSSASRWHSRSTRRSN